MRGGRAPARDVLRRQTRLREGRTQAERLRSLERRANSAEGAPPAAPRTLGAERLGSTPAGSSSPPLRPDSPARSQATVGWDGRPPHLGELDLQVADRARQGRRLPVRLPVLHGPVGGGHGSSALPGPRRPSLRRWLRPGWCAACSRGDSSAPLYGATHASRPRGPSNWLQDWRKGGQARGEGAGLPHPTPPAALREPGHPPPGHRAARSPAPGGCPWRSSPEAPPGPGSARARAAGQGRERGRRGHSAQISPRSPASSPRRTCRPLPAAAPRTRPTLVRALRSGNARLPAGDSSRFRGRGAPRGGPASQPTCLGLESGLQVPALRTDAHRAPLGPCWDRLQDPVAQMAGLSPWLSGFTHRAPEGQEKLLALAMPSWASDLSRRRPPFSRGPGCNYFDF